MKMKVEDGEIKAIDQGEESSEFSCMWLNVPWFCEAFLCTLIRSTYLHTWRVARTCSSYSVGCQAMEDGKALAKWETWVPSPDETSRIVLDPDTWVRYLASTSRIGSRFLSAAGYYKGAIPRLLRNMTLQKGINNSILYKESLEWQRRRAR